MPATVDPGRKNARARGCAALSGRAAGRPVRRCIVSGTTADPRALVRFVVSPDGAIVPDVEEKLPGRGLWIAADRSLIETAQRRRLFARAARATVVVADDLGDRVEGLLVRRCQAILGLAVRGGCAAFGHDKTRAWLLSGKRGVLIEAFDGAPAERRRLRGLAPSCAVSDLLSGDELGAAIGRDRVVHGIILDGGFAASFLREAERLAGFRKHGESSRIDAGPDGQAGTT